MCEKKKGKSGSAFIPPTLTELVDYCVENNILSKTDAERCFYYYDSQNWKKANGCKVSSWKGCVRTWSKGDGRAGRYSNSRPGSNRLIPDFDYSKDAEFCL